MATEIGHAYITIMPSMRGVSNRIRDELSGLDLSGAGSRMGESIGGGFGDSLKRVGSMGVRALTDMTAAVGGMAVQGGIARAMKLDEAYAKFNQLGMDVPRMMESVSASVKGTRYSLDAMANTAVTLGSAGVEAGDEMTAALKSVASVASISGVGVEHIGSIFTKVASAGHVTGRVMQQLQMNGINATAALAKSLGKTNDEISAMVTAGEIDFSTFANAMYEYLGDASVSANKTFTGSLANVRAALSRVGASFAQPGIEALRQLFVAIIPAVDAFAKALLPLAERFADFLGLVKDDNGLTYLDATSGVIGRLVSAIEWLVDAFTSLSDSAQTRIAGVIGAVVGLVTAFKGIAAVNSMVSMLTGGIFGMTASAEAGAGTSLTLSGAVKRVGDKARGSIGFVQGFTQELLGMEMAETESALSGAICAESIRNTGAKARTAAGGILANTTAKLSNVAATVSSTAANTVNAVSQSRIATAARNAATAIMRTVAAHKAASIAALGLAGGIALLAVGLAKSGGDANVLAEKINAWTANAVNAINAFSAALPGVIQGVTDSIIAGIDSLAAALPAVIESLTAAMATLITQLAATLPQVLPPLVGSLVTALTTLVMALVGILPTLVPQLLQAGITLFTSLATALVQVLPSLVQGLIALVSALVAVIPTLIPPLLNAAVTLFMALAQAFPQVLVALTEGLVQVISAVCGMLPTLIPALIEAAVVLFMALVDCLPQVLEALTPAITALIGAVVELLPVLVPQLLGAAVVLFMALARAVPQIAGALLGAVRSLISGAVSAVGGFVGQFIDAGRNIISGLIQGITSNAGQLWDSVKGLLGNFKDNVLGFFGIHSPSKVFAEIGGQLMAGMAVGIDRAAGSAASAALRASEGVMAAFAGTSAEAELSAAYTGRQAWSLATPALAAAGGDTYIINGIDYADNARIESAFGSIVGELDRLGRLNRR